MPIHKMAILNCVTQGKNGSLQNYRQAGNCMKKQGRFLWVNYIALSYKNPEQINLTSILTRVYIGVSKQPEMRSICMEKKQMSREMVCRQCGRPLVQNKTGRKRYFCCDPCRRAWWREHPEELHHSPEATYIITCKQCGKKFTSYGNRNRKYCSHKCYIYHRFYLEPEVTADVRSALEKKQLSELPEELKAQVIRVLNESK